FVAQFDPRLEGKLVNIPQALKPGKEFNLSTQNQSEMKGVFAKLTAFFGKEVNEQTTEADMEAMIQARAQAETAQTAEIESLRTEINALRDGQITEDRITELAKAAAQEAISGINGITDEERTA